MVSRNSLRLHRHQRIRAKIQGTIKNPRISIFLSSKHIYAQLIDDEKGNTIIAASDYEIDKKHTANQEIALEVGKLLAKKAKTKKITQAVSWVEEIARPHFRGQPNYPAHHLRNVERCRSRRLWPAQPLR